MIPCKGNDTSNDMEEIKKKKSLYRYGKCDPKFIQSAKNIWGECLLYAKHCTETQYKLSCPALLETVIYK